MGRNVSLLKRCLGDEGFSGRAREREFIFHEWVLGRGTASYANQQMEDVTARLLSLGFFLLNSKVGFLFLFFSHCCFACLDELQSKEVSFSACLRLLSPSLYVSPCSLFE